MANQCHLETSLFQIFVFQSKSKVEANEKSSSYFHLTTLAKSSIKCSYAFSESALLTISKKLISSG